MSHPKIYRLVSLLTLITILASAFLTPTPARAAAPQPQQVPRFEEASCMFSLPPGAVEGTDVTCGYLTVPEFHAKPEGATIQLAVAIIHPKNKQPLPDPLIMAQGGPGGSTIDTYASRLLTDSRLRGNRDIILFDQRGTLYSKPALLCTENFDLTLATLNEDLSQEESDRLYTEALGKCHDRLVKEGVNLSAFNSFENAADINDLTQALGYEQVNLYGVSYGTLLALHALRAYPNILRSVIIDSVVPPQTNFILEAPRSENRSFSALFDACKASPACDAAYPDLEKVFFDLVERFNKEPVHLMLTDTDTGEEHAALLNGDGLISMLFQMLYATEILPYLPKVIYEAQRGEFTLLKRIMEVIVFDRTMSEGMYYSVICAEDSDFSIDELKLDGIRPQLAEGQKEGTASLLTACKNWAVTDLGSRADEPVVSDVPTLVLSGAFDPITPPAFGQAAAATLSRSYAYTFLNGGHGAALSGQCQDSIILQFLDDPNRAPDTSCIAENPMRFTLPGDITPLPAARQLLMGETLALVEGGAYLLALLFLLAFLLVWPLIWIIRIISGRRNSVPFVAHLAPWLAAFNALLLTGFITGLIIGLVQLAQNNDMMLFYGLPAEWRPLFILPILVLFVTAGMLALSVQSWAKRWWSVWERIYYSLTTASALFCLLILILWKTWAVWLG